VPSGFRPEQQNKGPDGTIYSLGKSERKKVFLWGEKQKSRFLIGTG
jgi:hypothetical protein